MRTAYRVCPLCEATCGLEVTLDGDRVVGARGDRQDLFSRGFVCPKGAALGELDDDPDRLRRPLIRTGGRWREATWPEAFARIDEGLRPIREAYGANAVACYLGNPNTHTMARGIYLRPLLKALGTRNIFRACWARTNCAGTPRLSRRRPSKGPAVFRPRPSGRWRGTSRPPPRPRCTRGSAPRPPSSAR
jgi:anaerobic selenocysteine-containing dehydrogenase